MSVSIITLVCLERWLCFLVAERARLPLPFDLPLTFDLRLPFDLRRANVPHLIICRSIQRRYDAPYTTVRGRASISPALAPEGLRSSVPDERSKKTPITFGRHRASQFALGSILVPRVLSSSSITCSKVFPSSSFARLTSLPLSSTYSASTGNSATLATTSSSTISPFSS